MRTLLKIIKENIIHRHQVLELAKFNLNKTYRGSDFGFLWAFVKPSMYIFVFYIAISIGFKSAKDIPGIISPYFIWLAMGMISFFYMRDMVLGGAASFRRYKHLVTSTAYPIMTIPTSIAISNMLVHFVMLGIGFALTLGFGVRPSVYWIQLPFYMALMFIFSVVWSIATGLISVVYRDFYNLLQVINQALFWLSAILFDVNSLGKTAQKVLMFNPITYIVEGYRNAICRHVWFFEEPQKLGCYLLMLVIMTFLAVALHKKLRKVLPDIA